MIKLYPSFLKKTSCSILLAGVLLISSEAYSQIPVVLSGTYTVGGTNPDFATLDSVVKVLNNATTVIGQAVTFKLRNGVYNNKFTLKLVAGVSNANTITFTSESGDASKVIIRHSLKGTNASHHTIRLDGANYIIFSKLTIENQAVEYSSAIHLTRKANNNRIENCVIRSGNGGSSSVSSTACIVASDHVSMFGADTCASYLSIVNNRIVGGYYNIRLNGPNTTLHETGNIIDNNVLDSAYVYGIYTYYNDLVSISNNKVSMRTTFTPPSGFSSLSPAGIYCYYTASDIKIVNNEVLNAPYVGIYLYQVKAVTRGIIGNNRIGGNFYQNPYSFADAYGMTLSYCSNLDIIHNSISFNTNNSGAAALNMGYGNTNMNVFNNILASYKDAYAYYITSSTTVTQSDNNVLYTNGQYLVNYIGDNMATLNEFRSVSGKDQTSLSMNPGFVSNTNLHITNNKLDNKGRPVSGLSTDMDNQARHPFAPDPGADEILIEDYDIALYNLRPTSPGLAGNQVQVTLINQGKASLAGQTLKLSYSTDGGLTWTPDENYSTANLNATYKSEDFTFSTLWNPVSSESYELCVRINSPGHPNDTIKSNDQLCRNTCAGFITTGTYTVGGLAADFTTINDAVDAISCGIIGPVTFNINTGIYAESITIPVITGSSQFATVTFQAATGNPDDVVIKNTSALSTFLLKGADFIRLRNLTIENTITDLGSGIYLADGADNNIINNCKIILRQTTTDQASCGILSSTSAGFGTAGLNASNTQITNNQIIGGYSGIYLVSSSTTHDIGNSITGNRIDSVYYYGIRTSYNDFSAIDNNRITFRGSSYTYGSGIYCSGTSSNFTMNNNIIRSPGEGIELYSMKPQTEASVTNNMISCGIKSSGDGIILSTCSTINIYHNSIYNVKGVALRLSYSDAGIRVQNNILVSKNSHAYYVYDAVALAFSNHNIFHSDGQHLISLDYKNYSLSAYSNYSGWDTKSLDENPQFISGNDLHATNKAINNKGLAISSVGLDIDNEDRHPFTPDPGADEFIISSKDLGLVNLQPVSPLLGLNQVKATLINEGSSAPGNQTVVLTYSTDNGTTWISPQSVTTSDIPNTYDYKEITFSVPWTISELGTYNLCARIDPPGLSADTFKVNEVVCVKGCAGFADQGEYTIGVGTGSDFQTIQEAINALECGIISPVTFKIRPGVYEENIIINPIIGASFANPVRIEGEGNVKDIKIISESGATFFLNGADYITFKNLTVSSKFSESSQGFLLKNGADNNTIENCIILLDSNSTSSTLVGISVAGDYDESSGSNNIVRNNQIRGGGTGILVTDGGTIPATGNIVTGNSIFKTYGRGIDASYCIQEVSNNKVYMRPLNSNYSYGIEVSYITGDIKITGNYIADANSYGIYMYSIDGVQGVDVSNNTIVMNSEISSNSGITLSSCSTINVYHNSVQVDCKVTISSFTSNSALDIDYGNSAIKVKDNILSYLADGYAMYVYTPAAVVESDFNNYYTTASKFVYWSGNKANLSALRSANSKDANSISIEPGYYSEKDLHTNNPYIDAKGTPVANVTQDYDKENRDTETPDIGSDEFESFAVNLAVMDVLPQVLKVGQNTIEAVIKNMGLNSLSGSTVRMSYSIDGGSTWTSPEQFTLSNLDQYNTSEKITFNTPFNLSVAKDYNLCVRINAPGILNDGRPEDDKLCETICTGLAGSYTVGGANPDFKDLDAAFLKLACGLGGPVTLKLRPAIYNQQVVLSQYINVSDINTLTIESESGNPDDVTFVYDGVSWSNHAVIQLNGAKHVTLRNLTIINSGGYYASGINLTNNAAYNRIEGCKVELNQTHGSSYQHGISITGTDISSTGKASHNTIANNHITGGYYGIYLYGLTNADTFNTVINNRVDSFYYKGIYSYRNDGITIKGNTVTRRLEYSLGYGIHVYGSAKDIVVTDNIVKHAGSYGIFLDDCSSLGQNLVANNMIAGGFTASTSYGMYVTASKNMEISFNSISCDNLTALNSYAFYLSTTTSSVNLSIQNNIFANSGDGYAYYIGRPVAVSFSDNNNYYTKGLSLAYWSAPLAALADLQASNNMDVSSKSIEPHFKGPEDLHIINPALDKAGSVSPFVKLDIDGNDRDKQNPDIGCDEFTAREFDLAITEVKPIIAKIGDNVVSVTLTSEGIQPLKDSVVSLSYSTDGGVTWSSPESLTITGILKPFDKQEYSFNQLWNVSSIQDYTICVRVNSPGIISDTLKINDIFCQDICVGVMGTFTVGGSAPDFLSIGDAVNSIYCGIAGPIVIKVRPGTYNESFIIPQFKNASEVNTLTIESETGNPDDVIIKRTKKPMSTDHAVIRLNGSDHVILKDLTIVNDAFPGDTASGINLVNRANYNTIRNCRILMDTTSGTVFIAGIVSSSTNNFSTGVLSGSYNRIVGNKIIGGHYGILLQGTNSTSLDKGNSIDSNLIRKSNLAGVSVRYTEMASIHGNTIDCRSSGISIGISCFNNFGNTRITNNYISGAEQNGIELNSVRGTQEVVVANNMITGVFRSGTSTEAGIYTTSCTKIGIYNNSVYFQGSANAAAIEIGSGSGLKLKNNNFCNFNLDSTGFALYISSVNITAIEETDYNNFYTKRGKNLTYWGSNQRTLANHKATTSKDANSINVDPLYFSATDLHTVNPNLDKKGVRLPQVPIDFDGEKRSPLRPDIGADEFIITPNDIALLDVHPKIAVYGTNKVRATVLNEGFASLKDSTVSLSYSTDGGTTWSAPETFVADSLIKAYDTEVFEFAAPWNITIITGYELCVRINTPGLLSDTVKWNETVCDDVCVGIDSGSYTVGGSNPNFQTFADVLTSLNCGILGSVVFNVRNGVYNERVSIPALINASPDKTITFRSATGNPDSVILISAGGGIASNHHTLQLNGTSYVTFENISIKNTASGATGIGSAVHLTNGAHDNTFRNCRIYADSTSISFSLFAVVASDLANLSAGTFVSNNTIENCYISGGFDGIRILGNGIKKSSGNKIIGNTIRNANVAGINLQAVDADLINRNHITMRPTNIFNVGILIRESRSDYSISDNYIYKAGSTGIYLDKTVARNFGVIANNMLAGGFTSDGENDYGIALISSNKASLIHNTVHYDGDTSNASAIYVNNSYGIQLLNNLVYNAGKGYAYTVLSPGGVSASDYNDLFTNGSNLVNWGGVDIPSLALFKTVSGTDQSSISVKPLFKGLADVHTEDPALNGRGYASTLVTTDFDGEPRDINAPDIGADEFTPITILDGSTKVFLSPSANASVKGPVTISIRVNNVGTASINGTQLSYAINNGALVEEYYPATILPGDSITYTFAAKWYPKTFGAFSICAKTNIVNDVNPDNDKLCINVTSLDTTDGGINTLVSPTGPITSAGDQEVKVTIKNFGNTKIGDFQVAYKVNSNPAVKEQFIDSILPGATVTYTFVKKWTPSGNGTYNICSYTDVPFDSKSSNNNTCKLVNVNASSFDTLDAEVNRFISPANGSIVNNTTDVKVKIYNKGNKSISNIPIILKIDGAQAASETISQSVAKGDSITYTFFYKLNPISGSNYCLEAYTTVVNDLNFTNDTAVSCVSSPVGMANQLPGNIYSGNPYPNPSDALFNFDLDLPVAYRISVYITDLPGKKIFSQEFGELNSGTHQLQVNLSELPVGTYLYHIHIGEHVKTGKIVLIK